MQVCGYQGVQPICGTSLPRQSEIGVLYLLAEFVHFEQVLWLSVPALQSGRHDQRSQYAEAQ